MKFYAVRNLRLCTKDCLCLYVCPTGATDTENSIIDTTKCIGCENCAKGCPSGAITMVPCEYPPQQPKKPEMITILNQLSQSKTQQEKIAEQIAGPSGSDGLYRLMKAIAKSERIMAEDVIRESGFMLPQSHNAHLILQELIENPPAEDFPVDIAKKLLAMIPDNED